jgi:anthranilate/para-aminobenzoate synthase component I
MMKKRRNTRNYPKIKKENSEHVMLVDLARNDLSRNGHTVTVDKYREVQFSPM